MVCIYHVLCIQSSTNGHWVTSHFGIVDNVAMNMSVKILFESMLSIRWGIYPERESLDQVVILCLVV